LRLGSCWLSPPPTRPAHAPGPCAGARVGLKKKPRRVEGGGGGGGGGVLNKKQIRDKIKARRTFPI
jgi:hypothetical protein